MLGHPLIFHIKYYSSDPSNAVDFFVSMLHPDPAARMTMAQAARHPYMAPAMQKLLFREARLGGPDRSCSTYASTPLLPTIQGPIPTSHSVCIPPSIGQLSSVSSSTTARASLSFRNTAHCLYLICQHHKLPQGLSLISRVFSTMLRYIFASKAKQTSAAISKPAGQRIINIEANCNVHLASEPRPADAQSNMVDCMAQSTADEQTSSSSSSSSSASSCSASNDTKSKTTTTTTTEVEMECSSPDIR